MAAVRVRQGFAYEWHYECRTCPYFDFGFTEWRQAYEAARSHSSTHVSLP